MDLESSLLDALGMKTASDHAERITKTVPQADPYKQFFFTLLRLCFWL